MQTNQRMSPAEVNTNAKVRRLQTDNHSVRGFWILTDGEIVTICQQNTGATITVPRLKFLRLIAWFQKPQPLREERT